MIVALLLFFGDEDEDEGDGNDQDSTLLAIVPMTSSTRKNPCGVKSVFAECIVVVVVLFLNASLMWQMGRIDD
jgi:hypothetical protein